MYGHVAIQIGVADHLFRDRPDKNNKAKITGKT